MLRWDEILSLPVQSPPTLEFSSSDIVWSKVVGWRDKIDRVARIPFPRVGDFVRGESSNKECPTRFHVEARRRRPPEMHCKQKVDGILEYILYWCSFGPDDHRKGGIVRPSRSTYIPKKKSAGRPNTKRGCVCHFIVKRLIADPSIALIIYNQDKHVDKNEQPCHGPQDKRAVGTRAMFAPYISDDLRLRVLSLLHVGVSVETIMQRHNESVQKQGGPCNRDDLLTHRYVRRLERSIRRSNYELDEDDMVSIGMWVESHQSHVFFYEDFTDSDPFILGIQTEWQLQQMIRFGNCSLVVSDLRFGMNKLKYPVHSLLVFDSDNKLIPVAWIITSRFASENAHRWIRALYNRVHSKDPTWRLGGFVVDDPSADVLTIREVFHCSVLICFWRVRHAWHKNLVKKCPEIEMCFEMFRRLGQAVYSICEGNGDLNLFEDFMEDFVDCSDFMDYFKAVWFPRIGMWITALKTLPVASQETCAALECYHHQLKLRLLNEKNQSVYQRTDWLVDKLGTKVHSYFWLDEYSGKEDFARYRKDEWMSGLTSWRRALKIPDSDVVFEGRCAKVISQHVQEKAHVVWNPGCEFAICDCNWSRMGNLCKHVIKVSKICRNKGSATSSSSLFKYKQTLIHMLHCPPHDSLIRDHALSLAVCVQMQLNVLIGPESSQNAINSVEKQSTGRGSANRDRGVVNERQSPSENILSSTGTNSGVGDEAEGNVAGNSTTEKVIDQVASGNGVCGEVAGEVIGSSEMDVDPLPSSTSPVSIGSSRDRGVVNEKTQSPLGNIVSSLGTISGVGESQGNFVGYSTGDKVIDQVASDDGVRDEIAGEVIGCTEMDVDQLPSSTSPVELVPPDQVPSTCGNLEIKDMNLLNEDPGNRENLSFDNNSFTSNDEVRDPSSVKDCQVKKVHEAAHGDVLEGSMMDVDSPFIQTQTSSSALGVVEQSEMAGENGVCSNLSDTTAVDNTYINPQPVQTSPSGSVPIEPQTGNAIDSTSKLDSGERDLQNRSQASMIICSSGNASNLNSEGSLDTSTSILNSAGKKPLIEVVATENGVQIHSAEDKSPVKLDVTSESIQISSRSEVEQQTVSGVVYTNDAAGNGENTVINESQVMVNSPLSTADSSHIVKCGVQDGTVDENLRTGNQIVSENGVCCDI